MSIDEKNHPHRREVLQQGWALGWALAVSPVTAFAQKSASDDVVVKDIRLSVEGGTLPVYTARPKGKGPFPAVLVIQEIFGIHAYIQDVCRRLAREGYLAAAPDLYFRQGDATKIADIATLRSTIVDKTPQTQVWADVDATARWIAKEGGGAPGRLAITGFCWGGNVTWSYAAHNPAVKAGVAWYGKLSETAGPAPKQTPIELAPKLTVPVLGLYGAKDGGIPLKDVEAMRAVLGKGKSGSRIDVYPEADHGFHADYRPSFHAESAADGWKKLLAWFREHGV